MGRGKRKASREREVERKGEKGAEIRKGRMRRNGREWRRIASER